MIWPIELLSNTRMTKESKDVILRRLYRTELKTNITWIPNSYQYALRTHIQYEVVLPFQITPNIKFCIFRHEREHVESMAIVLYDATQVVLHVRSLELFGYNGEISMRKTMGAYDKASTR
jgi:hypothetical protein